MGEYMVNATGASLLGYLHERPMAGWDLVATVQRGIGNFWSITQSQVYRELNAMAKAGLVEAGERGRRDRQPFAITNAGRAAFQEWVAREPGHETIRFPLLMTLTFGRYVASERLAEMVAHHERMHAERLTHYRELMATIPEEYQRDNPYSMSTLHFGLLYEEAVMQWFAELPEVIRGRRPDDTDKQTPDGSAAG